MPVYYVTNDPNDQKPLELAEAIKALTINDGGTLPPITLPVPVADDLKKQLETVQANLEALTISPATLIINGGGVPLNNRVSDLTVGPPEGNYEGARLSEDFRIRTLKGAGVIQLNGFTLTVGNPREFTGRIEGPGTIEYAGQATFVPEGGTYDVLQFSRPLTFCNLSRPLVSEPPQSPPGLPKARTHKFGQ